MTEILIVLALLLTIVFLKMGIKSYVKGGRKALYFFLSAISLLGLVLLLLFSSWSFGGMGTDKAASPPTETEAQNQYENKTGSGTL
jgi:hypothetical protein